MIYLYLLFLKATPEKNLIDMTNKYRIVRGLKPVTEDPGLDKAAAEQASHMSEKEFLSHKGPKGAEDALARINKTSYKNVAGYAENIAQAKNELEAFDQFKKEPRDNENMLGDFTHIGVVSSETETGRVYWAEVFAKHFKDEEKTSKKK